MLTVIRKRVYKSGFQKQGINLEHLLNDEIKTNSGVVRTQVAIVFFAKGPCHPPCRKIAPGLSATLTLGSRQGCPSYVQNRAGQHYERNRLFSTVDSPVRYVRDMDVHSEDLPLQRSRISAAAGHWLSAVQDAAKVRTVTPRFWI
jgi:hypothetical protein